MSVAAVTEIAEENTGILTIKVIMHFHFSNPTAEAYKGATVPEKCIRKLNLSCHLVRKGESMQYLSKDIVSEITH